MVMVNSKITANLQVEVKDNAIFMVTVMNMVMVEVQVKTRVKVKVKVMMEPRL